MSRKIKAEYVRIGMFIEAVDRPWLDTKFNFQGFPVETPEDVMRVRKNCDYVFIREAVPKPEYNKLNPSLKNQQTNVFFNDLARAREMRKQTKNLMKSMHDDVQTGSTLDISGARNLISEMVPTIAHNPDAMVWMTNLKNKDEYTAIHSINVCILSLAFGHHLGLRDEALITLGIGALLHDIGKLRVPLEILNKPEKLTNKEYDIIKLHPRHGQDILQDNDGLGAKIIDVALLHHEKFAGGGYPHGRKLNKVSDFFPQIVSIIDVYDALTSDRVYRKGTSPSDVIKMIYEGRSIHYHPNLVDEFAKFIGIEPIGSLVELNTGEVGITLFSVAAKQAKPVVLIILDTDKKKVFPLRLLDFNLIKNSKAGYRISQILPGGSYGININDYVNDILFSSENSK